MQWSQYMQTPRFLEMTRKYFLCSREQRPVIRRHLAVEGGMKALDVACGSGFFTRLLAEGLTDGGRVYGLEQDDGYLGAAKKYAQEDGVAERTEFLTGDALQLPFPDDSFDLVVSHTFFNVIKDYRTAMQEMIRVVKDGGTVASVDNMSLGHQTWHTGYYEETPLFQRLGQLEKQAWEMYQGICPIGSQVWGVATSEIPHFFFQSGLKDVRIHPLGRAFSLSNAAMPEEDKRDFIRLQYETSVEKLEIFRRHEKAAGFMSDEECGEYLGLLGQKRDYLLAALGENEIWEWHGGANLLTVGSVRKTLWKK